MPEPAACRFGRLEFRPKAALLLKDGAPVPIGSRALSLLGALLEAPGSFRDNRALTAAVWPALHVSEANLRVQVSLLRRAIDEPGARSHIVNAPGRGYALVTPVHPAAALCKPPIRAHDGAAAAAPENRPPARGRECPPVLNHGVRKFPSAGLIAGSAGRGWQGVAAELRRHPRGALPPFRPEAMEVTLALTSGGTVRRRGNGTRQETPARPGMLWLCPIGVYEDSISISDDIPEVAHVYIPDQAFSALSADLAGPAVDPGSIGYIAGLPDPLVEQIVRAIAAELVTETAGGRLLVESLALSLLLRLAQRWREGAPARLEAAGHGRLSGDRLRRVLELIGDEIESDLTIARLADVACLSRFHFARSFRRAMGVSPSRYVAQRRLEHARALLSGTDLPLAEVALACRFSSQSNFTRAFQRATGRSPASYRALSRA